MARQIKFKTITIRTVTPAEEAEILLARFPQAKQEAEKGFLKRGTFLQVTKAHSYLAKDQIVIVERDRAPDDDGEYSIFYLNSDGDEDTGFVTAEYTRVWSPPAQSPETDKRKGRKLTLDPPPETEEHTHA